MDIPDKAIGPKPAKGGTRYGFIDLLRGCALVVMIETHVINSYLPDSSRHNWFFFWLTFFNGLVAPTFLFASGFSIMLQGSRQWNEWLRFRAPFWRQMRRLGFIVLVAYYSHLDHFKLSRYLYPDDPGIWKNSLQVDILQCIVASLLIVHLLIFLLRKPRRVAWGALVLALTISVLTPWMWSKNFIGILPLSGALFLNPHGISLFPLFPWTFFLLCGVFTCQLFLEAVSAGTDARLMRWMLPGGVVMILFGLSAMYLPFSLPGYRNFFTTSPNYMFIRLGCVLIFCSSWYALEKFLRWVPNPVRLAGQESLLVYGVHLWVIFAFLRGKHAGPVLGLEKGYLGCFLLSAAIIVAMLWLARGWHALKLDYPRLAKRGQALTVLIMLTVFLSR